MGFTKIESVVLTLVTRLLNQGKGCIIYLNNLFTSTRLLGQLRELGIGGCSTFRTSRTTREENNRKVT